MFFQIRESIRQTIICGVCHKPVDRAEVSSGWGDRTIRVWCHGETEDAVLTEEFLRAIPAGDLRRGTFTPFQRVLAAPEQKLIGQ